MKLIILTSILISSLITGLVKSQTLYYLDSFYTQYDSIKIEEAITRVTKTIELDRKLEKAKLILDSLDLYISTSYGKSSKQYISVLFLKGGLEMNKRNFVIGAGYMDSCINLSHQMVGNQYIFLSQIYHTYGVLKFQIGDMVNAELYYKKAIEINLYNGIKSSIHLSNTYNNLSLLYRDQLKYDSCLVYFNKLLEIQKTIFSDSSSQYGDVLNYIGTIYTKINEYDKAIQYYEQRAEIESKFNSLSEKIATTLNSIGFCYTYKYEFMKADKYFQSALKIQLTSPDSTNINLASIYNNMGLSKYQQRDYDGAINFYLKSYAIKKMHFSKDHREISNIESNLSGAYQGLNDIENSYKYRIMSFQKDINASDQNIEQLAKTYYNMAVFQVRFISLDSAIHYTDIGLKILKYKCIDSLFNKSRSFTEQTSNLLQLKGSCLINKYVKTGDTSHIFEAYRIHSDLMDIQQLLAPRSYEEAISLQVRSNNIISSFVRINENIYQFTQNIKYRYKNWELIENSKNKLLLNTTLENKALKVSNIPDSILLIERTMKNKKIDISKDIDQHILSNESLTSSYLFKKRRELDSINYKIDQFNDHLDRKYPDFTKIKFNSLPVEIREMQSKVLTRNQTLLQYAGSRSNLELYVVTQDTFFQATLFINALKIYTLAHELVFLLGKKSNPGFRPSIGTSILKRTVEISDSLFISLIQPIQKFLKPEVIISPNSELALLPFEVLLISKPKELTRLKDSRYFGIDYSISYIHSATLLYELNNRAIVMKPNKLIALAPFNNENEELILQNENGLTRDTISNLPESRREVKEINKFIGGNFVIGKDATKENFLKLCNNYSIIHLATHGAANKSSGDYSWVAFANSNNKQEFEKLYAKEIYKLNLESELVTLSSCESNSGQKAEGEGIISLSRAFLSAGAKSTITSMWKVNDATTSELMISFYQNLKEGFSKNLALRKAKASFIKKHINDVYTHPHYWAGFILNGSINPLF